MPEAVKIIVTVPETQADALRQAIGDAGAGDISNYSHCSFSVKGVGRFLPQDGAHPAIGSVGKPEAVIEERIEVTCTNGKLPKVMRAILATHPYEAPAIDIYPLLRITDF